MVNLVSCKKCMIPVVELKTELETRKHRRNRNETLLDGKLKILFTRTEGVFKMQWNDLQVKIFRLLSILVF